MSVIRIPCEIRMGDVFRRGPGSRRVRAWIIEDLGLLPSGEKMVLLCQDFTWGGGKVKYHEATIPELLKDWTLDAPNTCSAATVVWRCPK